MILYKLSNFPAKLFLALSITNTPKLKIILCESASLVTEYIIDDAQLLIECKVLYTRPLQLF